MEIVIARLEQLDYVFHFNVVIANNAKLVLRVLKVAAQLTNTQTGLENILPWAQRVNLIVLRFVKLRRLYSFSLHDVLVVEIC